MSISIQASTSETVATGSGGGAATSDFMSMGPGQGAGLSAAGTGRIIYNNLTGQFQISENGGAYSDILTTSQVGWTDDGTTVRLTTSTDQVSIGNNTAATNKKLTVEKTGANVGLRHQALAAGDVAEDALVTGDTNSRVSLTVETGGGAVRLGSGSAAEDVALRRTGARALSLDHGAGTSGAFTVTIGAEATTSTVAAVAATTAATVGAALALNGGAGQTSAAGGAASVAGGVGGATGVGGAASVTGGAGGGTSGAGGAASVVGGTPVDGAGGAVSITGANGLAPTANARAGGAVSITAGNGATGVLNGGQVGANVSLTAGAGGINGTGSAAGGTVTATGGAGTGGGAGGAASQVGGAGNGAGAGGLSSVTGGAAGATGAGGAATLAGAAGGATSGAGGIATVRGGAGTAGNGNGGDVNIEPGDAHGSGTNGVVRFQHNGASTTPDVLPRANNEGSIGTAATKWANVFATTVTSGAYGEEEVWADEYADIDTVKNALAAALEPKSFKLADGAWMGRHLAKVAMLTGRLALLSVGVKPGAAPSDVVLA